MKANEYRLLVRCIEDGVQYGWMRAHKHTDEPDEELIKEQITQAVINEICEWFEFPDLYGEEE